MCIIIKKLYTLLFLNILNGLSNYPKYSVFSIGSKLPKITEFAPLCLREDLMESLYIHHLLTPPLFQTFPQYFLRQLATKLNRIVMFPGELNIYLYIIQIF